MPLSRLFKDHPESVGETYVQHMRMALGFSFAMAGAALCCFVHALLPFLFERTGSSTIERLSQTMIRGRRSRPVREPAVTTMESDLCA